MVLSFQDLMEARASHYAQNPRTTPLINKEYMQYWTSATAGDFFASGGLNFSATYDPSKELPPSYTATTSAPAPAAPNAPAPAPSAPALLRFTNGQQPTKPSKWMRCTKPNPSAELRFVFFPWTGNRGGQGSVFGTQKWPALLANVELYEVSLPGRGMRMGEPLRKDPKALVGELAKEVGGALQGGKPYVFVGFAFGAILAHETALAIRATLATPAAAAGPCTLISVSCEGPGWSGRKGTAHTLSPSAFEDLLRQKGGTEPILADKDIAAMFVPIIQADLQLEEKYAVDPPPSKEEAAFPILALRGGKPGKDKEKTLVTEEALQLWVTAGTGAAHGSKTLTLDAHDWYVFEEDKGAAAVLQAAVSFVREAVAMPGRR